MEIVILSGAELDLDEIHSRVEAHGGGERFLLALDRKLELLRTFPKLVPLSVQGKVRQVKIDKTPYGLFYSIEGSRLMVIAIQDLRQDPRALAKLIRARL